MGFKIDLDDLNTMPTNKGYRPFIAPPKTVDQEYDERNVMLKKAESKILSEAKAIQTARMDKSISLIEIAKRHGLDADGNLLPEMTKIDGELSSNDIFAHYQAAAKPFLARANDPAITAQEKQDLLLSFVDNIKERLSGNKNNSVQELELEEAKDDDLECIDDTNVVDEPMRFALYPYIPEGELTVLHGGEGVGKNILVNKLMALATIGKLSDIGNTDYHEPMNCWFVSLEDKASAVFKRIRGMGGDVKRLKFTSLKENGDLPTLRDVRLFKKFAVKNKIKFLAIDNFGDYSSEKTEANSHKSVAQELGRITKMAQELEMILIIFFHDNKMNDINGSRAIRTKAGSVLGLTKDDERANHTILTFEKARHDGAPSLSFNALKMVEQEDGWREAVSINERKMGSWFAHFNGEYKPLIEKVSIDSLLLTFLEQNGPTSKKFLVEIIKDTCKVKQAQAYALLDELIMHNNLIITPEGKSKIISLPKTKHEEIP